MCGGVKYHRKSAQISSKNCEKSWHHKTDFHPIVVIGDNMHNKQTKKQNIPAIKVCSVLQKNPMS
jgi:hypothetical protein